MATPRTSKGWPKLSLKISTSNIPSSRTRRATLVDPSSPTAFNTLSNVYATAIDRSTPVQEEPLTAIRTVQPLRIQTSSAALVPVEKRAHTPYIANYPETPLTAHPMSPVPLEILYPSTMTATPPMSAGPVDSTAPTFTFSKADISRHATLDLNTHDRAVQQEPSTPASNSGRSSFIAPIPTITQKLPYSHPCTLHSILRNSPLPAAASRYASSPRRQSARLQEKAGKKVCYNNPLTQTIVNNKYTISHNDLLNEEASPMVPAPDTPQEIPQTTLDLASAYTEEETRDGGMTPGPFEEMRRRIASLGTSSPLSGPAGIQKRKRKEKKRNWIWTINQEEYNDGEVGGAIAAIREAEAAGRVPRTAVTAVPTTAPRDVHASTAAPTGVESGAESTDVEMSDSSSFTSEDDATTPSGMDLDQMAIPDKKDMSTTPVAVWQDNVESSVQSSLAMVSGSTTRRDTPVPESFSVS